MFNRIRQWAATHPRWTLTLLVCAALGPFLAKPFNIDDPLFIWLAQHVQTHPANFFGFQANWHGQNYPFWAVTENPPGAGYYLALFGSLFGFDEIGLHFANLLAALAVILGTHRLALRLCGQPLLAACAVLCTPAFLVSANTVMCDVLLLASWVWAVVFWTEGLEQNRALKIIAAGVLVTLAVLTKYFGVALIPLLAAYGMVQKRKFGGSLAALLIPLAALGAYQWLTYKLYGHAHFTAAASFSSESHVSFGFSKLAACLIALSFTGGSMATVVFLAPWLWRARTLAIIFAVTVLAGVPCSGEVLDKYTELEASARTQVIAQMILWMTGGVLVLWLAVADVLCQPRDPHGWLLALWVAGTFLFTAMGNWTINGRTVLPMAPAVGILLARRYQNASPLRDAGSVSPSPRLAGAEGPNGERAGVRCPVSPFFTLALVAAAVFALLIAQSDFQLAIAVRRGAQGIIAQYGQSKATVWFEGHWGFQYYMDKMGAKALDYSYTIPAGDIVVVPLHNVSISDPSPGTFTRQDELSVPGPTGLTTFHPAVGAGFYSAVFGPLPFAFGHVPDEKVYVYQMK